MDTPGDARIDWAIARSTVLDDEELLREIVDAFLSEADTIATNLSAALTSTDSKTVSRLAHTLKSNLRTFGVPSAEDLQTMELAAKHGDLEPAKTLWPSVRPVISLVCEQMQRFLGRR